MRKTIPTLLLVLVAGVSVFLAGWTQLKLPAGYYGVLVSKTSGISDAVLEPGAFRWSPLFLLPTNARVLPFSLPVVTRTADMEGEYPSGASYAAILEGKPDFSWAVKCVLVVAPDPRSLPGLVRKRGVETRDALESWTAERADAALCALRLLVMEAVGSGQEGLAPLDGRCAALLRDRFPELSLQSVQIVPGRLPDPALYARAKGLYRDYSESYAASLSTVLEAEGVRGARDSIRLETLEKYGKLLERYPLLVQYLAVEKGLPPFPILPSPAFPGMASPAGEKP